MKPLSINLRILLCSPAFVVFLVASTLRVEGREYSCGYDILIADADRTIGDCTRLIGQGKRLARRTLVSGFSGRADAYVAKDDFDHGIADYDAALKLMPNDARMLNRRGVANLGKGDLSQAIEDFGSAIAADPDFSPPSANLAAIHAVIGVAFAKDGDHPKAIAEFEASLGHYLPGESDILFDRGNSYLIRGDFNRAILDYSEAVRLEPSNSDAYFNRGNAYAAKLAFGAAIKDYFKAAELKPKEANYFCGSSFSAPNHPMLLRKQIASYAAVGEATRTPYGWADLCGRQKQECEVYVLDAVDLHLGKRSSKILDAINQKVNAEIIPISNLDHWGTALDHWDYPTDGKGDDKIYALWKRKLLMDIGFPRQALLMTIVRDLEGNGHTILTVKTDRGEFVLDNMVGEIRAWDATGYTYVKRQSQNDPNVWVAVGPSAGSKKRIDPK